MALWALGMGLGTEAYGQSSQAAVVGRRRGSAAAAHRRHVLASGNLDAPSVSRPTRIVIGSPQ